MRSAVSAPCSKASESNGRRSGRPASPPKSANCKDAYPDILGLRHGWQLPERVSRRIRGNLFTRWTTFRCEEHAVVSQPTQAALALPGVIRPAAQRRAEQPWVPREGALCLPTLPVDAPVTAAAPLAPAALPPLPPGACLGSLPPPIAAVRQEDRRADAPVLPGPALVLRAGQGGLGPHAVSAHSQGRLGQGRAQRRRVVGRAAAHGRRGEEGVLAAGTREEAARGGAALQAGAVPGGCGPLADQAALLGARGGREEEPDAVPLWSSRCVA